MAEFLLELLSEEIPPAEQERGAAALGKMIIEMFAAEGVAAERMRYFSSARRIGVCCDGIPAQRAASTETKRGPKKDAPQAAIEGFKRSLPNAHIELREGYYFAQIEHQAVDMRARLCDLLPPLMRGFGWKKSMRWIEGDDFRWIRPLRSILCLLDGETVPFTLANLRAGNQTCGHHIDAPDFFAIASFAEYKQKLEAAYVLIDPEARREKIKAQIPTSADSYPALIGVMAALSEYPILKAGRTSGNILPSEMITHSIYAKEYCYLTSNDASTNGASTNGASTDGASFLMLIDGERKNDEAIAKGVHKVLQAQINDANFFIETDQKTGLDALRAQLAQFSFHEKLGTMLAKADRLQTLVSKPPLNGDELAARAAHYAKADIASLSGREFPEALGAIGAALFLAQYPEAPPAIAEAIQSHVLPLAANDRLATKAGQLIALADRADMLVGFFAIGEVPTGSKDPFALRRAALSMVRTVLESEENDFSALDLSDLFRAALALYEIEDADKIKALHHFIAERLKYHLRDHYPPDLVDAAMKNEAGLNLRRIAARLQALSAFLDSENGAHLMTAWQRLNGILKNGAGETAELNPDLLSEPAEKALAHRLEMKGYIAALNAHHFTEAFDLLAALRADVDDFFDHVRVEVEDSEIRENRYALCRRLRDIMRMAADFSSVVRKG